MTYARNCYPIRQNRTCWRSLPTASKPMTPHAPRSPRYASLDFWRGLACLSVVLYHATFFVADTDEGGIAGTLVRLTVWARMGVPMFFVISGYCISAAADSTRLCGRSSREYFTRRFRRIYPPYWAWFAIVSLFIWLAPLVESVISRGSAQAVKRTGLFDFTLGQLVGNLTLTWTWLTNVIGGEQKSIVAHSWTLCYEEQFYALFGLALIVCRKHIFVFSVIVTAMTLAIPYMGIGRLNGTFLDGTWLDFAAGILVYWVLSYGTQRAAVAAVLVLLAGIWAHDPSLRHEQTRIAALGFAILLLAFRRYDARLCSSRLAYPIVWCGRMCYSIYLVHAVPTRIVARTLYENFGVTTAGPTLAITVPLCLAASVLAGWAFHVAIERRFLNSPAQIVRPPVDRADGSLDATVVKDATRAKSRNRVALLPTDRTAA